MGQTSSSQNEAVVNALNSIGIRLSMAVTSGIQLILGLACVVLWSLMLDCSWDYRKLEGNPIVSSPGIWAGTLVLVSGVLGLITCMKTIEACHRRNLFVSHFAFTVSIPGTVAQIIINANKVYKECGKDTLLQPYCTTGSCNMLDLGLGSLVAGCLAMITIIPVVVYYAMVWVKASKVCPGHEGGIGQKQ